MRPSLREFRLILVLLAAVFTVCGSQGGHYYPTNDYDGSGSGSGQRPVPMIPSEVVVGFERASVFVREGRSSVELCAAVFEPFLGPFLESFSVTISTEDGNAKAGSDYIGTTQTLGPFTNTSRRLCTNVNLIDDDFCESNPYPEDFSVTMVTSHANVTVSPRRIGVAIDDSPEPECNSVCVGFDRTSYVVVEEVGHVLVCVRVLCPGQPVRRDVSVQLTTASNTAKAGQDFVLLDHVTVGPLGPYTRSRCVAVEIIDDGDCEQGERFYLSLESTDPLVSFPVNNAVVVIDGTTEYDDCASVRAGFIHTHYQVRERNGVIAVCVGAFEPEKFGARFNLMATTRDGTARAGIDYVPLTNVVVGPLDRTSRLKCFQVRFIDDSTCGDDPGISFTIELSSHDNHVFVSPSATRVYILDAINCIQVRVGLIVTTSRVREDELMATVCASVFSPAVLQRQVLVLASSNPNTAEEGEDFLGIEGEQLSFSRDTRTLCFNITILNDGDCEDIEFFSVSLSSSEQRVLVTPSTGYVIISDPPLCTSVEVGLEQQSFTTYEGADSAEVCVRIERGGFPSTQPFNLLVSTQDGSATAPSDYLPLSDVTIGPFTADNDVQCFSVTIVRDAVCEGEVNEEGHPLAEVFSAVVRSEEGSNVEVRGSSRVATIFIEEAAECIPVVVGFDQDSYTARERDGPLGVIVDISSPPLLRRNVTLTVQTVAGTATPNVDYLASSLTFQLTEEQRSLPLSLLVADDRICDSSPSESLQILLSSSDPNITLSPRVATVTIIDSPECVPGTVTFQQASFVSSEEVGWAVVCASFSSSPSPSSFSLTLSTYDITARAGEDYVSVSTDLSFGPNVTQHCQLLLLVQDGRCESTMTESFGIRLTSNENGRTAVQDSASVVIYDSPECITVRTGFEGVVYSQRESRAGVVVCAEITSPAVAEREFFLLLSSSDRDAVAGEDYVGLQDLPLGPFSLSQRRNCLSVALTDDSVCEEPEESFVLSLSTDDEFIEIGRDSVTVYIEDGLEIECVQVRCGFEGSSSYLVQETFGQLQLCVSVYDSLRFNFTINITTVDGSATGGLDFTPVSNTLSFFPGLQRQCVSIPILNDQECEDNPNEMFTVVIRGADPRCVLEPNSVTVTIDDRGQFVTLSDPDCFPLEIYFTENTPLVSGGNVAIVFNTQGRSLPQTISCDLLNGRGNLVETIDCTSGQAVFSNVTRRGFYTVKATVITGADSASASRRVRLDPDPLACSAHLINRGLGFRSGGVVVAEFAGVGPAERFTCTLDGILLAETCTSPVTLSGLETEEMYIFRVTPVGDTCSATKKLRESFDYFEPYSG